MPEQTKRSVRRLRVEFGEIAAAVKVKHSNWGRITWLALYGACKPNQLMPGR
jgi:hypothetical protein